MERLGPVGAEPLGDEMMGAGAAFPRLDPWVWLYCSEYGLLPKVLQVNLHKRGGTSMCAIRGKNCNQFAVLFFALMLISLVS